MSPGYKNGVNSYYQTAKSSKLFSWTSWTSSKSWNYDIGVIRLNRPIGALTGWRGYGYATYCSWFTTYSWQVYGYPANSPYNGRYMYTGAGDFDWCSGNQAGFNKRSYGGQSGSGHVKNGRVYAVLSNGTNTQTRAPRLTRAMFYNIRSWISSVTPSGYDLIPLKASAPSYSYRSRYLSYYNFIAHNYSKTSYSGRVCFDTYLSTNNVISRYDRRIGTHCVTVSIPPKGRAYVRVRPYISSSTPARTYYTGVIIRNTDAKTSNNITSRLDVDRIRIY